MAPKVKTIYVCSSCGCTAPKWCGQCPDCGEWNTMNEEIRTPTSVSPKSVGGNMQFSAAKRLNEITEENTARYDTGIGELNRVLGGGLVKGSLVLLSGDPGIGKSTILLQACENLGKKHKILYVAGEESAHQIKSRALRLGVKTENLYILCETDTQYICEYMRAESPDVVIIDSVQTLAISEIQSLPGSITQVRESTNLLMRAAKSLNIPVFIVGHVNKDGNIAGPKVLEHIVDCVLYFEGEKHVACRILRAVKNRFGSTNEIGVFEMCEQGLLEVTNPSKMLISGRAKNASGSCITCTMEGSRPILAEVQGLVTTSGFGNPRRMSTGFDYNRTAMLLAVLEKRAGYFFGNMDCYVNIAGGLRLDEPAADLSVAVSLVSSMKDTVVPENILIFGEIGLSGEVRSVNSCEQRIREGIRLGFEKCIIPYHNKKQLSKNWSDQIEIIGVRTVREAVIEAGGSF
ncbi:MAG: DNA repair protein RadA [Clostridia bacterium]|nr:DNA repair protein RadA [Clostridia bacterium]